MKRNRHKVYKPPQSQPAFEAIVDKIVDKVPDKIVHIQSEGGHSSEHTTELRLRTQQIAIGLPLDEVLFSRFFTNYIGLDLMPWDVLITAMNTYLPAARNEIHNAFLKKPSGTHLFMLDSDVLPPPRFIETLLAHNKPIVGGWYSKKEKFWIKDKEGNPLCIQRPVVYDFRDGGFYQLITPRTGLESVDGAGAGCWLMSRAVAEAIGESPYGNDVGEDLILCTKIREAGFDLWVDWSQRCAHCGVFFI